jgi:CheY-like chemotaxis protein
LTNLENDTTVKPRILLVDDDKAVRETLEAILEMEQFEVSAAGSVAEALHLIDTESFDALVSDLHMPGAGGWIHSYQCDASQAP